MRKLLVFIAGIIAVQAWATELTIQNGITIDVPAEWTSRHDTPDSWLLERHNGNFIDATLFIDVEQRRSHDEAVQQLAAIEVDSDVPATWGVISGWPSLERKDQIPFELPELYEPSATYRPIVFPPDGDPTAVRANTAVAAADLLVTMETIVQPDADPKLADEALAIGRTLKVAAGDATAAAADVQQLKSGKLRPSVFDLNKFATATINRRTGTTGSTGATGRVALVGGRGEIEAAISLDGTKVVTVADCATSHSSDGGVTYLPATVGVPPMPLNDGDCSITWGPSGNFYRSKLGSRLIGVFRSTDQGASFPFLQNAVDTTKAGISVDQPHVAADRLNVTKGNDRVYVVWQQGNALRPRIACSIDSGATWSIPVKVRGGNLYPRVAVGRDGMVYVVTHTHSLQIDKFSDCASGLQPQRGFPVRLPIRDVVCPVPGVDRCNSGNRLSLPTMAADDLKANTIYLGFAQRTADSKGENIVILRSTDGGATWTDGVNANTNVAAVRFLPWIGVSNGIVSVGWYDRRSATSTANDLTAYYKNNVYVIGGKLTPGTEINLTSDRITTALDAQCAGPWPMGTRTKSDSKSCSSQPQLAGFCGDPRGNYTRPKCDFSDPGCAAGVPCRTDAGSVKFGDYNGLAVANGRLVSVWAARTAPAGTTAAAPTATTTTRAWAVVTLVPPAPVPPTP